MSYFKLVCFVHNLKDHINKQKILFCLPSLLLIHVSTNIKNVSV